MAKIVEVFEGLFSAIGMGPGGGPYAPMMRFIFVTAASGLALNATQPSMFYHADGTPKPWIVLSGPEATDAVLLPWWAAAASLGAVFSLFI